MSLHSKSVKVVERLRQAILNRWTDLRGHPIEIDSQGCEFGFEMYYHIGYAYYAYQQGRLKKTISCRDTKCFYWFSPEHEERYEQRRTVDWFKCFDHKAHAAPRFNRWRTPDFKSQYQDRIDFGFERPVIAVFNKYNSEWEGPPVNFLSKAWLIDFVRRYRQQFDIVYARPTSKIVHDNSDVLDLDEKADLKQEGAFLIEDLHAKFSNATFNEFQLCVLANADIRVAVQGGTSYLNGLFPGHLAVLHRKGLESEYGSYDRFPQLGGAVVHVTSHLDEVSGFVERAAGRRLAKSAA
tara:strand:+ start:107538 stop:108422 length:885 start_codon:yes stop_codon:yes gene_type:complete